jgi:hypothetical protein
MDGWRGELNDLLRGEVKQHFERVCKVSLRQERQRNLAGSEVKSVSERGEVSKRLRGEAR